MGIVPVPALGTAVETESVRVGFGRLSSPLSPFPPSLGTHHISHPLLATVAGNDEPVHIIHDMHGCGIISFSVLDM